MPSPSSPITVALIAAPAVSAATPYGLCDALCSAGRDWQMLHGEPAPQSLFRPIVVSRDGGTVIGANEVPIRADASLASCPSVQAACITDLALPPGEPLGDRYDAEIAWLRERHDEGTLITSARSISTRPHRRLMHRSPTVLSRPTRASPAASNGRRRTTRSSRRWRRW